MKRSNGLAERLFKRLGAQGLQISKAVCPACRNPALIVVTRDGKKDFSLNAISRFTRKGISPYICVDCGTAEGGGSSPKKLVPKKAIEVELRPHRRNARNYQKWALKMAQKGDKRWLISGR